MKYKRFFYLVLIPVLLTSCSGTSGDLVLHGLKGHVHLVKEYQCDPTYEGEQWVAGSECTSEYRLDEFDEQGRFVRSMTMDEYGDTLAMNTVKREDGLVVEEIYFISQRLTPRHSRLVPVTRTIKDRISKNEENFEIWQQDQLKFEGATYYDSKGRIERQVQVVNNREVMVHHVYDRDLRIEMYREESNGMRSATQHYEYVSFDEKGNWTLRLVYVGEEKIAPELAITREITYR